MGICLWKLESVPSREVTEHAVGRARAGQQQQAHKQAGRQAQAASSACTGTAALGVSSLHGLSKGIYAVQ